MPRYRWELHRGETHKFLDASIDGKALTLTEGRIGTNGRRRIRACSSASAAEFELMILASGRLRRQGWTVTKVTRKKRPATTKPKRSLTARARKR